jgi:hypothetical protein
MDTVLDMIISIEKYADLALNRVHTHPIESVFALMKQNTNDINTPDELEHTIAKTDIVSSPYLDPGISTKLRNRISLGGVRIGDSAPSTPKIIAIPSPEHLTPEVIADVCLKEVHVKPGGVSQFLSDEEEMWFCQFVQYLKDLGSSRRECHEQPNQSAVYLWFWQ